MQRAHLGDQRAPCLPWHSTPSGHSRWLSLRTEWGLSRTWHRGSLSSGSWVSLISGTALVPYSRHTWVSSPCWSSRLTLSHIAPDTPSSKDPTAHTHTPFLTYEAPSDTHLQSCFSQHVCTQSLTGPQCHTICPRCHGDMDTHCHAFTHDPCGPQERCPLTHAHALGFAVDPTAQWCAGACSTSSPPA